MTQANLSDFNRVIFFTGAGVSAESGVPTYRGKGGIWKHYDYGEYACQAAFDRDPQAVWEFHNYRRSLVAECEPNAAHYAIAQAEATQPNVTVVTQNIDGLHQRAGSQNVIELHGSLWRVRDELTGVVKTNTDVPFSAQIDFARWWRPDIVWFGDALRGDCIDAAIQAIAGCDLLVSIGTSAVVYPAADLPRYARDAGALCIEINPEETPMSGMYDLRWRISATEGLQRLQMSS